MKRLLAVILLCSALAGWAQQTQIDVKKAIVRDWIIYQGDTLAITSISGDTIFVGGDTLISSQYFDRDSGSGMLTTKTEKDKVSESSRNMPYQYLNYWKDDLIKAFYNYSKTDNAKIAFMGDSYTTQYGLQVKQQASYIYGYGGGYESFQQNYDFTNYGTYVNSDWTYTENENDPYVIHNRFILSTGAGKVTKLTCKQWNTIRLHYKTRSGGGTFTVKKGQGGSTLATIDTDAAAGDAWYVYSIKDSDQTNYDTIFVTSSDADSISIYGFQFQYNNYLPDQYTNVDLPTKKLEVSILGNGGAPTSEFYTNKDTASIRQMLDTLDISLLCFVNLDPVSNYETSLDSLVGFLKMIRPEMDICLLAPNASKNGYSDTTYAITEKVAKSRGVAYIDTYTEMGSLQSIIDAGLTTDSIHLASDYPQYFNLISKLLPAPSRWGDLSVNSLTITDNRAIIKPNGTNFLFTTIPLKATFTGVDNTAFGFKTLSVNTTGTGNTAIGSQAVTLNTTGSQLTGIGQYALYRNTTGSYNTATGRDAIYYNTTGEYNTAVGYLASAGVSGYSYSYNVTLGALAGRLAIGNSNTYIGANSGYGVGGGASDGIQNTGIGQNTFFNNRNGTENVAVGFDALYNNTNGYYNTAIGNWALFANTTSSWSVAIGYYAGRYNTLSNRLYIDAGDKGSLANDSTQSLIFGNFATNRLTINGDITYGDTFWRDAIVSSSSLASGVNAPTPTALTGTTILMPGFNYQTQNDEMYGNAQFNHDYKIGTDIEAHCHWSINTSPASGSDTVVIEFEYAWADISEAIPSSTTVVKKIPTYYASGGGYHRLTELVATITGSGGDGLSSIIWFRIERLQDNASDTYNGFWLLHDVDFHYQIDSPGSDDELTK